MAKINVIKKKKVDVPKYKHISVPEKLEKLNAKKSVISADNIAVIKQ